MSNSTTDAAIDVPFTFTLRPTPLPADLRPAFRIALLVLVIEHCRGARASVEQLHVMDWSIRTPESRHLFLEFVSGMRSPSDVIVRYDPSLARAIGFALAEGMISQRDTEDDSSKSSGAFRLGLTPRGKAFADELIAMDDCLADEKIFLRDIGRRVTQEQIRTLLTWSR